MKRALAFLAGCFTLGLLIGVIAGCSAGPTGIAPWQKPSVGGSFQPTRPPVRLIPPIKVTRRSSPPRPYSLRSEHASRSEQRAAVRHHSASPAPVFSYHSASNVWDRLAACESTGEWHINTGNGYYGGLQITATNAAHYGYARPDLLSRDEQIALGEHVESAQGWGAWPVCARRIGLLR